VRDYALRNVGHLGQRRKDEKEDTGATLLELSTEGKRERFLQRHSQQIPNNKKSLQRNLSRVRGKGKTRSLEERRASHVGRNETTEKICLGGHRFKHKK